MRNALLSMALCCFVVIACSDDEGASNGAGVTLPCTNDATAEAVRADDYSVFEPHYSETPTRQLSPDDELDCRIHRAMLTPAQLPGWKSDSTFGGGVGTNGEHISFSVGLLSSCDIPSESLLSGLLIYFERRPESSGAPTSVSQETDADVEVLDEMVLVFAPAQAPNAFEAIGECLVPSSMKDVAESHWAEPLEINHDADEAIGFREFIRSGGDDVGAADTVYLRYANVIIRVRYGSTSELDGAQTQTFVTLAESVLKPHLAALDPDRQ
jgi:hypothetical protein